jgi:uncharacterized caspase-like protein
VNQYEHANLPPLQFAVNDVTVLGEVLATHGYTVTLLTDQTGKQNSKLAPTKANIERTLRTVLENCKKSDRVVVAFAGHGLQFDGDKEGYFCPSDSRPFKNRTETLVSLGKLYQEMESSFAGVKVLLVDACRNDPQSVRGVRGVDGTASPPRGVAALFSCSAGECAYEFTSYKHGIFFYHVIEGFRGKAMNATDKEVTVNSLSDYVAKRVKADVGRLVGPNVVQQPHQRGESIGGSPVLAKVRENTARVPEPSTSPNVTAASATVKVSSGAESPPVVNPASVVGVPPTQWSTLPYSFQPQGMSSGRGGLFNCPKCAGRR